MPNEENNHAPGQPGSLLDLRLDDLKQSSCSRLYRIRNTIETDPIYQRQGSIWRHESKQLFIDSILNAFDIPKIYLHQGRPVSDGFKYAIIDGKQRLEALFEFFDGKFGLADDFEFVNREEFESHGLTAEDALELGGLTYGDLEEKFPPVARALDAFSLQVVVVMTDDIEAIEEMFARLNDAAPLNAAEKRRAKGGPMRDAVDSLVQESFFTTSLPFPNTRYRHLDLGAKFLRWSLGVQGPVGDISDLSLDVKKERLDALFEAAKSGDQKLDIQGALARAKDVCSSLEAVFETRDKLLSSVGTVSVAFLSILVAQSRGEKSPVTRVLLDDFDRYRRDRLVLETDREPRGVLALTEYNRTAQSPNDGAALATRVRVLEAYCSARVQGSDPLKEMATALPE